MLMGKGRAGKRTGLAVEKKAAASTPTTGWDSRARWNSRAKSRAPAPSLSSFLFLPTGTFFLTWTLPSRFRWLIILVLTHRTGCAALSVLSSRCLSPCIESSCGAIAKSSWKWGFFFPRLNLSQFSVRFWFWSCLVSMIRNAKKFWPLITVLNKASLQNQLQNSCARSPEDSNKVFDRVIREWLL